MEQIAPGGGAAPSGHIQYFSFLVSGNPFFEKRENSWTMENRSGSATKMPTLPCSPYFSICPTIRMVDRLKRDSWFDDKALPVFLDQLLGRDRQAGAGG